MATKTITTPAGIARFPSLNRPDTKFSEVGVYKVNLEMSSADAEPFIKQIEALFAEFLADKKRELKKDKLKLHPAPWEDNDGVVQLKLKVPAMGKNKETGEEYSRKPALFDATGKEEDVNVGGGSKLKIAVVPYCWYTASLDSLSPGQYTLHFGGDLSPSAPGDLSLSASATRCRRPARRRRRRHWHL
jgi:hypothetical protein